MTRSSNLRSFTQRELLALFLRNTIFDLQKLLKIPALLHVDSRLVHTSSSRTRTKPSQHIATPKYIPERFTISFRRLLRNNYFYSLSKTKFSAFATLFAALLVSEQAVNPEANVVDASPVATVVDIPAPEASVGSTGNKRQVRGASDGEPVATTTSDMPNKSRDLSCRLCCSDDTRC